MARVRARMHPGRVLREEYMEPMQLSASELAAALDITPNRISAIIDDTQRDTLTSDIALRLARRFRTSPQFWLGLQNAYDLSISQAEMGAEIEARIQPLPA
jgi:addiction module HigA family antidote